MGLSDFFKKGVEKPSPETKAPAPPKPVAVNCYTVKQGDSLSSIAKHYYGDTKKWTLLYDVNKSHIKDPDKIFPGMVLTIPEIK
jgi:nucleoid-associated protein YgaU